MDTQTRRRELLRYLQEADGPLTGSQLAREFSVSRQIIVGDISVIRAMGVTVYATPQGYVLPQQASLGEGLVATVACRHTDIQMAQELNIIVDNGGFVRDVIVEHPLYGEIRADLRLRTRHDVDEFQRRMLACNAMPLSIVTAGVHLHTIEVPNNQSLERIRLQMKQAEILAEDDNEADAQG